MYVKAEKSKITESRAVANFVVQKKSHMMQGVRFVDNQPKTVVPQKQQNVTYQNIRRLNMLQLMTNENIAKSIAQKRENQPVQLLKKPGEFYSKEKISNQELYQYLKGEEISQLRAKIRKMKEEPFLKSQEEYAIILESANKVAIFFQAMFELHESSNNKEHTIKELDEKFAAYQNMAEAIEKFSPDSEKMAKAYDVAAFKGNLTEFVEWISMTTSGEDFKGSKGALDVLGKLSDIYPLRFKWIKADIMATRDNKFFIKQDLSGDRVAAAKAIKSLVFKYNLEFARGPEKIGLNLAGQKVSVAEGLPLETEDDNKIDGYDGITKETVAELGFIILHTGVGDINSMNARKLKDKKQYAILDTGGSFAGQDSEKESFKRQVQTNYSEYYETLGDFKIVVKKWDELKKIPPDNPSDILKS